MRVTRLDILGLVALLAAFLGQGFLVAAMKGSGPAQEGPSWQEEEHAVQQKVQSTLGADRREFEARLRRDPALLRRLGWIAQGFLLLVVGAGYIFFWAITRLWRGRPVHPALGAPLPPPWGLRDILRIVLWSGVFIQWVVLAERALFFTVEPAWMDRHVVALGNTLLLDGAVLALMAMLLARRPAPAQPAPGRSGGNMRRIRFALVEYLTFLPVLFLMLLLVGAVLHLLGQPPKPQPVFTLYFSEERAAVLRWLVVLVTVIGPIAEEVFFRGVVYRWLRTRWGVGKALAGSALFFSVLHGDPVAFVPIFGLGILFGWVYERTGSLAAAVSIHILHNAGMLTLASLVKDLARVT